MPLLDASGIDLGLGQAQALMARESLEWEEVEAVGGTSAHDPARRLWPAKLPLRPAKRRSC